MAAEIIGDVLLEVLVSILFIYSFVLFLAGSLQTNKFEMRLSVRLLVNHIE